MILSCPGCATAYFVDDDQIGATGRQVRCARCGRRWRASAEAPALAEPQTLPAGRSGANLPRLIRRRAGLRKRLRAAAVSGGLAGAVALSTAGLVGAAILWRAPVVRAVPPAGALYALLGMPVNRMGLVIEGVRAEPTLQDGRAALAIEGTLRNITPRSRAAPPLRIVLYNAHGAPIAARVATPRPLPIPPGGSERFAVAILDPPLHAHNLEVSFVTRRREAAAPHARALAASPPPAAPPLDLKGPLAPVTPAAVAAKPQAPAATDDG